MNLPKLLRAGVILVAGALLFWALTAIAGTLALGHLLVQ